jgi:hypothetical protein
MCSPSELPDAKRLRNEVDGKKYKVKVIDGEAVEEDRGGRKLLRIKITAEVSRVEPCPPL